MRTASLGRFSQMTLHWAQQDTRCPLSSEMAYDSSLNKRSKPQPSALPQNSHGRNNTSCNLSRMASEWSTSRRSPFLASDNDSWGINPHLPSGSSLASSSNSSILLMSDTYWSMCSLFLYQEKTLSMNSAGPNQSFKLLQS